MKIGFYIPEINFATDFPGCNCLLPAFSTGGFYRWLIFYLLLLISNLGTGIRIEAQLKIRWSFMGNFKILFLISQ